MITRRLLVIGASLAPLSPAFADDPIGAIERRAGGRLGVAVLDTGSGRRIEHRAQERFAMCSTFKFLLVSAVLARVDSGREKMDRAIAYTQADLVPHSPVAQQHLRDGGMTVSALCQAATTESDNTAADLLLRTLGGAAGWTAYARSLGDRVSRLDRGEPDLNSAVPGDPRDTTTPAAMLADMHTVLLRDALSDASRWLLESWMAAGTFGRHRLLAGVPADWRAADKTGSGQNGARNDIAIFRRPHRAPVLASVYFAESALPNDDADAVLADVGRAIAAVLG